MRLQAFRVKNYRSIIDTGWKDLAPDNVTGLIGQNESGKTAILEALLSFSNGNITEDILRSDMSLPEISCSFQIDENDIQEDLLKKLPNLSPKLIDFLKKNKRINITRRWDTRTSSVQVLEEDSLIAEIEKSLKEQQDDNDTQHNPEPSTPQPSEANAPGMIDADKKNPDLLKRALEESGSASAKGNPASLNEFVNAVLSMLPVFVKFEDYSSLLPNEIDVQDINNDNQAVEGMQGVMNFLTIANKNINELVAQSDRFADTATDEVGKRITADFQEFWTQKIGRGNKISVEFSIKHHGPGGNAGLPYLVFWINDGGEKLYPKQRSGGVRWFTSFYLQLKATAESNEGKSSIYLIDEPGGSLHARAQENVLQVFEDIKDRVQIIYTTHSPFLIDINTIYRLLAVQRNDEEEEQSETVILTPSEFGTATTDTLTPIYTLMGANLSDQQAIPRNNNVILEELSGYYYLLGFWKLTEAKENVFFIPANGVTQVPTFAYLFLGWGLGYCMVFDDDKAGRGIYNQLKKDLFFDESETANKYMYKISKCNGIEDIFTKTDFKSHVLEDSSLDVGDSNSKFMKNLQKPIFARNFWLKVKENKLKIEELNKETQNNIKSLVENIQKILH